MYIPIKLKLVNFRSISEETLTFKNGETYLLQGVNNTDEGSKSNGSGKSSFREALSFVLGLPVFADSIIDLINNYTDSLSVEFECVNSINKNKLIIRRSISRKDSTKLCIELNGIDQKDEYATTADGDRLIMKILGVPKEDMLNHFIISREKFTSFFSSSDNSKKDLINRFSGAYLTDGIDLLILEDIKTSTEKKSKLENEISILSGKILVYQNNIEELLEDKSSITSEYEESIIKLEESVKNSDIKLLKIESDKKSLSVSLPKLEEELLSTDKKLETIKGDIDLIKKESDLIKDDIHTYTKFSKEVESSLAGVVKCPKCNNEFNPGEDIDVEEARLTVLPSIGEALKQFNLLVEKKDQSILLKKEKQLELKKHKESVSSSIDNISDQISDLDREARTTNRNKTQDLNTIEDIKKTIQEIKTISNDKKKKELETKIIEINTLINDKNSEISEIDSDIFSLNEWVQRFKKFKSYLANQSLTSIQGYTNLYLEKMKSNINIRLEGFKQNKDGSIREKITPVILRDGIIEGSGSYKKYSGGERCRIDVAITLAMRQLINQTSKTGGFDLFWIDEITEGIDSLGIENLADSINKLGITSIITSHIQHEKNYPNILTAEKNNGVTILN